MSGSTSISFGRFATVLVVILSWFVATNHCALGLQRIASETQSKVGAHACCHAAEGDSVPQSERQECCDSIFGSLAASKVAVPAVPVSLMDASAEELALIVVPTGLQEGFSFPSAGPPRVSSFAELVLQVSLPAHAPPSLA